MLELAPVFPTQRQPITCISGDCGRFNLLFLLTCAAPQRHSLSDGGSGCCMSTHLRWKRGRLKQSCSALWHWSFHFVSAVHARTANVVCYWFLGFKPDWISLWCCIVFKSGVPDGLHLLPVCPLFIYAFTPEHRHGQRRCLGASFVMNLISEGQPGGGRSVLAPTFLWTDGIWVGRRSGL